MVATAGRDFLLQLSNGASPAVYTTVSALTEVTVSTAGTTVDITTMDDAGQRKLLSAAGTASATISASGVFTDAADINTIIGAVKTRTFVGLKINNSTNTFTITGQFQPTSAELVGSEGGTVTYSLTFESAAAYTVATS